MTADRPAHAPRLALAATLFALLVALALPARAATSGNEITRYDVAVTVAADGADAAPADVDLEEESGWLQIRIDDEDKDDVRGLHRYVLSYPVRGLVNAAATTDASDELYWNVIGDRW